MSTFDLAFPRSPSHDDLMAKVSIRIDFPGDRRLGPGKVTLLEGIDLHGSIAAAGRAMGMSYRRAWLLVAELNGLFREPLVEAQLGGRRGGGAALTRLGSEIVQQYRALENETSARMGSRLEAIEILLAGHPGADGKQKKRSARGASLASRMQDARSGSPRRSRTARDR
jgi:molybdate transport system regulatory protein